MGNFGVANYCGCAHSYGGHLSVCSLLLLGVDGVVVSASGGGVVAIVPMVGINALVIVTVPSEQTRLKLRINF